jgi:DNA-binding response OmpR family regulator
MNHPVSPVDTERPAARVLVAEIDTDLRNLVVFKLEQSGYEVVAANDGREALSAARALPPDLAVLDSYLPGMSGLEVCRQLRSDQALRGTPVILLTAVPPDRAADQELAAGADDYLLMPFTPRELVTRVRALLANGGR